MEWQQFIGVVAVPAVVWLANTVRQQRHDFEAALDSLRAAQARDREALAAYKLEVAKQYATTGYLRDVEDRLVKRLDEILGVLRADRGAVV
jgi:hypothetical protein